MCQDYMYSISRNVDFEALKRAGIDFVVVGNGSPNMIKSYRSKRHIAPSLWIGGTDTSCRHIPHTDPHVYRSDPAPVRCIGNDFADERSRA